MGLQCGGVTRTVEFYEQRNYDSGSSLFVYDIVARHVCWLRAFTNGHLNQLFGRHVGGQGSRLDA